MSSSDLAPGMSVEPRVDVAAAGRLLRRPAKASRPRRPPLPYLNITLELELEPFRILATRNSRLRLTFLLFLLSARLALAGLPAVGPNYQGPPAVETPATYKKRRHPHGRKPSRATPSPAAIGGRSSTIPSSTGSRPRPSARTRTSRSPWTASARCAPRSASPPPISTRISTQSPAPSASALTNTAPFQRGELLGNNPFGPLLGGGGAGLSSNQPLILDTQPSRALTMFSTFPSI